jgi:uncharacterized protein (DUF2236 family)
MPPTEVVPIDRLAQRPGPGSAVFAYFADDRGLLVGGTVLLMQVAHPAVGAGVAQHSNFRAEPWRRLVGTLVSISTIVYASDSRAAAEVARLREMHRSIRGTDAHGDTYSALQPGPWAWVHATLVWGIVRLNELVGTPLSEAEAEALWRDWLQVGYLLGVRPGDLPDSWAGACDFIESTSTALLEDNQSVHDVVEAISMFPAPRPLAFLGPVWRAGVGRPFGGLARLVMIGALPPVVATRLELHLTVREQRRFTRFVRLLRVLVRLTPAPLRRGPLALVLRHRAARANRGASAPAQAPRSRWRAR